MVSRSNNLSSNLVVIKTNGDVVQGEYTAQFDSVNLAGGVRLLKMPIVTITNEADTSGNKGDYIGSPELYPIVCEAVIDSSVIGWINALVQGINLGDVSIYQLTSSGQGMRVLNQVTLSNTFVSQVSILAKKSSDPTVQDILRVVWTLTSSEIVQIKKYEKGQLGTIASRPDAASTSA